MRKSNKMNGLFKTGFIILLVCIPMFLMALVVAYIFEEIYLSVVFSAGGAFLSFLGIIFVMCSKPKKVKPKRAKRRKAKRHFKENVSPGGGDGAADLEENNVFDMMENAD